MKLTTTAIALGAVATIGVVIYPIVNRVQENKARANSRVQSAISSQSSDRWNAAAKTFDKNKTAAAAIFNGADKVEVFRLFSVGPEKPVGKIANRDYLPYFSTKTVDAPDFATRLGALVLDAQSYAVPGTSTTLCYFEPAVDFRVWKGKQFVDTVICFKCSQLAVLENNDKIPEKSIGSLLRGRFVVAGEFIARPQLLALAKAAFPEDDGIQELS